MMTEKEKRVRANLRKKRVKPEKEKQNKTYRPNGIKRTSIKFNADKK